MFTAHLFSTRQQAISRFVCSSTNASLASSCSFVLRVFAAGTPPTPPQYRHTSMKNNWFCSTSNTGKWAQIFYDMKDARKQQAEQANNTQRIPTTNTIAPSLNETQDLQKELMETAVFRDKPTSRPSLSNDDIHFRNYLKSKLPRHEASEASERIIRNAMKEKD